jgi:hypothetical protein
MKKVILVLSLSALFASVSEASDCVQVFVEPSALCHKVKVKFDSSRCEEKDKVLSTQVSCRNEFVADVVAKTSGPDYLVVLTKNADGTWASGEVQRMKLNSTAPVPPVGSLSNSAIQGSQFLVTGQFRFRSEMLDRTDFANIRSPTLLRLRPKITWDPSAKVSVVFEPQAFKAFGEETYVGSGVGTNARTETSGTGTDPAIGFHTAFGEYKVFDELKVRVGRMSLSYGDEILLGSNETSVSGRSFDAALMRWEGESAWADLFTSKLNDRSVSTQNSGDKDLHGLYTQWHLGEFLRDLDLYSFYYFDSTGLASSGNNIKVLMYGVRLASDISSIDYRIEYTKDSIDFDGYQLDVDLGFRPDIKMNPRLGLGYFEASANYFEMFPTTGLWLGGGDVVARRNLKGGRARVDFSPVEALPVAIAYFVFNRNDGTQPAYKDDGSSPLGVANGSNSKDIGSEVNVIVQHRLEPAVTLKATFSKFFSGTYIKEQIPGVDPVRYFVQADIRF